MPTLRPVSRVPRIRVLAGGHLVIAVTILLGIAAAHSGQNLLHALTALLLAFQAVSGFRSYVVLRRLEVTVEAPARLDAETEGVLDVTIRNGKRRLAAVSLEIGVTTRDETCVTIAPAWVGRVGPGAEVRLRLPIRALARGEAVLTGLELSSAYPCDLFRRSLRFPADARLLVRPARRRVEPGSRAGGDAGPSRARRARSGEGEIHGLRPWREGDAPRRIHWKSSARLGTLVVREEEARRREPWILVLHPADDEGPAGEEAVAAAAALLRLALREGRLASLRAGGATVSIEVGTRRGLDAALDALALFRASDRPPPEGPTRGRVFLLGRRARPPAGAVHVETGLRVAGVAARAEAVPAEVAS